MTKSDWWNVLKTLIVIAWGVLGLLAAFGPLAQYREWLLLAAGIVSVVAGVVGVQLQRPTTQVADIKAHRSSVK